MEDYTLVGWNNDNPPAINQSNLNHMDNGIISVSKIADETKETVAEVMEYETVNIIDSSPLVDAGWTKSGDEYYGNINSIHRLWIYPKKIKENTRYTLSLEAYNASREDTNTNGLIVYIEYSDGTNSGIYFRNDATSFVRKTLTSTAGKNVIAIKFYHAAGLSAPNDVWHIKNIQLQEGTSATQYEEYGLTANDKKAREDLGDLSDEFHSYITIGKNICNAFDPNNVRDDVYVNNAGRIGALEGWSAIEFPVQGGAKISTSNTANCHIAFFSQYNDIVNSALARVLPGYLSGETGILTDYTVPENATYMTLSCPTSRKGSVMVEYGSAQTRFEPYKKGIDGEKVVGLNIEQTVEYHIYVDGSGSFSNLRQCLESITDSSELKKYIIYIHEGTYNVESWFTQEEIEQQSNQGLFVPNYVSLIGVGRRDNIILSCVLSDYSRYFSPIHFRNYGEMRNITVTATKCRYTIHDDIAVNNMGGYRLIENCKIIGNDLDFGCVYGSGMKEDCHWEIVNTIMDGLNAKKGGGGGLVFLSHNQLGWKKPSSISFKNCRFLKNVVEGEDPTWSYAMRFRSLITDGTTTWNNMPVYVHFEGTLCNGIELGEDGNYGSGIAYWVDGFSNKNAYEHVTSTTTPPVTVAERFNLIGSYTD